VVEVGEGVVGNDVVKQVLLARVDDLVWFTRWVQDAVACLKSPCEFARADFASSRHDEIELPFGRVTMEREIFSAGRETNQFNFKRGLRWQFRSGLGALKRQGNVAEKAVVFPFRRFAFAPGNVVQVDFLHKSNELKAPARYRPLGEMNPAGNSSSKRRCLGLAARLDISEQV